MLPKGGGGRAGGFAPSPSGVVVLVENKPKAPQPFPTLSDWFFFWSCPNQAGFGAPRPLPTLPGRCAAPEAARKAQGMASTRGFALPTSMLSTRCWAGRAGWDLPMGISAG